MNSKNTREKLIQEMKEQGATEYTLRGIISRLKTEKKQQMMLDYLLETKNIPIPTGKIILKSIEIKQMKD